MPLRGIAFFIAVVLLWTGLSTAEAPRVFAASTEQIASSAEGGHGPAQLGSVEHHHLDDLPVQAHTEPSPEPHDVWQAGLVRQATMAKGAIPRGGSFIEPNAPFLASPLRPPCASGGLA